MGACHRNRVGAIIPMGKRGDDGMTAQSGNERGLMKICGSCGRSLFVVATFILLGGLATGGPTCDDWTPLRGEKQAVVAPALAPRL